MANALHTIQCKQAQIQIVLFRSFWKYCLLLRRKLEKAEDVIFNWVYGKEGDRTKLLFEMFKVGEDKSAACDPVNLPKRVS